MAFNLLADQSFLFIVVEEKKNMLYIKEDLKTLL